MHNGSRINGLAPFFLVSELSEAIAFYRDGLGFDLWHAEPPEDPFFAMFGRGGAMLMVKMVDVSPLPNPARHRDARWDAYVNAENPDRLYAEVTDRGVVPHVPLGDTEEGLRGFEVKDPDGHVLFFGTPK